MAKVSDIYRLFLETNIISKLLCINFLLMRVLVNNSLPNLFVIGAPKAGTSALVSAIGQHPEIYVPYKKEPRFFDAPIYYDYEEDYPIRSIDEYLSIYNSLYSQNASYRVDGSVFNMYSLASIKNILKLSPNAKFVVMLRDPESASKSMHAQRLKYHINGMREISEKFCTCWRSLESRKAGKLYPEKCRNKFLFRYDLLYSYELYIPKILSIISTENIYIDWYERFKNIPEIVCKDIFSFLNVKNDFIPKIKIKNPSYFIKPRMYNKIVSYMVWKSYRLRKSFGLRGTRVVKFKKLLFEKKIKVNNYENSECDNEVRAFFEATYKYLKTLGLYEKSHLSKTDSSNI